MGKFDSILDDVVFNAKAAASAVSKKAVTVYDASKHKISAAEIRCEINKKLKELGKVTYKSEVHGVDLFAEKENLIAEIKELIENLNIINGHIAAIKSQTKCPQCEAKIPKNSVFCNICGTKLEDASAEDAVLAAEEKKAQTEESADESVAEAESNDMEAEVIEYSEAAEEEAVEAVEEFEEAQAEEDAASEDLFV